MALAIEVAGDPKDYVASIRSKLTGAGSRLTITSLSTLRDHYRDSIFVERSATTILYGLGLLSLFLTATGLHGVVSALFARRSKEFAIRMALGAKPSQLVRIVVRGALRLTACGLALGLVIALPLALVLASKQNGFAPWSLPAIGLSSATVLLAALASAAKPALRVLKIQPADLVRSE